LRTVVVCTEQGYSTSDFEAIARENPTHNRPYLELLNDIIKELLKQGRNNKLQTFGYSLEESANNKDGDVNMANDSVKVNFINLNKQCMMTRQWENVYKILGDKMFAHLYKEYIIFQKTRDESLV